MRALPAIAILIAGSFLTPLSAADKSQASKANVEQQLNSQYQPARLRGLRITQPGSILVVERNGMGASPATGLGYSNNYKDGQIKAGFAGAMLQNVARELQVGERVIVLKTEVKESSIVFHIQSCGDCDSTRLDPAHLPYKASLAFQFPKRYLETAPFTEIQQTIGQVFTSMNAPPSQALNPASNTAANPAPVQNQEPFPAPQPVAQQQPQAAPVNIELGQTMDQVIAGLGQPDKVVKLGAKEIYVYKDLKVTFLNGKVSDVE